MRFDLSWPPSSLRPNRARTRHWRSNASEAAAYKALCSIELRRQGVDKLDADKLHLHLVFRPPTRRHYDLDGSLSAFKAAIDTISNATGIDDRHYSYSLFTGEVVPGGLVEIHITEE